MSPPVQQFRRVKYGCPVTSLTNSGRNGWGPSMFRKLDSCVNQNDEAYREQRFMYPSKTALPPDSRSQWMPCKDDEPSQTAPWWRIDIHYRHAAYSQFSDNHRILAGKRSGSTFFTNSHPLRRRYIAIAAWQANTDGILLGNIGSV